MKSPFAVQFLLSILCEYPLTLLVVQYDAINTVTVNKRHRDFVLVQVFQELLKKN